MKQEAKYPIPWISSYKRPYPLHMYSKCNLYIKRVKDFAYVTADQLNYWGHFLFYVRRLCTIETTSQNNSDIEKLRERIKPKSSEIYRRNWFFHLQKMPQNWIPSKSYRYSPQENRTVGRPKKRWREQLNSRDGTGQMAQPLLLIDEFRDENLCP
jgi:hypothetical protein